jgi:hypothetical protein
MGRARCTRPLPLPLSLPPGARRRLPDLSDLDGPALCPRCGPIEDLTSGWLSHLDEGELPPMTLFCAACGAPVAVLG